MTGFVERLAKGASLSSEDRRQLEDLTLQDTSRAIAFGIMPETVGVVLEERSRLLQTVYPQIDQFCQTHPTLADHLLETLWNLWLPLATWLAAKRQASDRPWIQGILGGQGTGKTTLGAILTLILREYGYQTISLSLDDLYKTHRDRQQLSQADPRLLWRGPPGTHDIALGLQTLDALRQPTGQTIAIPRFDKALHNGAGDRTTPTIINGADIVLFEGWFVGVRPVDPVVFDQSIAPITTDADRTFARDMNAELHDYLPLWERLDSLLVLQPVDYRLSQQWRKQAEQQMRADGRPGMSDAEIDAFVEYFWKALHPELLIKPLVTHPDEADLVIEIQADHSVGAVYRGGAC
ncbi:glycerate kinase [Stenomitos frigidus ULC18]|uniref:Glycerate kinase n=1 Tax=Stenomitos frigidus ULC18 TaxID=2107698 RepID=A0A2T1EA00_9CYAN|nr:glycerate kinase [Stenomitos frigidus ULC18]